MLYGILRCTHDNFVSLNPATYFSAMNNPFYPARNLLLCQTNYSTTKKNKLKAKEIKKPLLFVQIVDTFTMNKVINRT